MFCAVTSSSCTQGCFSASCSSGTRISPGCVSPPWFPPPACLRYPSLARQQRKCFFFSPFFLFYLPAATAASILALFSSLSLSHIQTNPPSLAHTALILLLFSTSLLLLSHLSSLAHLTVSGPKRACWSRIWQWTINQQPRDLSHANSGIFDDIKGKVQYVYGSLYISEMQWVWKHRFTVLHFVFFQGPD